MTAICVKGRRDGERSEEKQQRNAQAETGEKEACCGNRLCVQHNTAKEKQELSVNGARQATFTRVADSGNSWPKQR